MWQVTPFTADLLRTTSSKAHVTDFLQDFHEKHWGRRNGVSVTYQDRASTRNIVSINNNFDLGEGYPILVRQCYLEVWNYLRRIYLDVAEDEGLGPGYRGTVLYGHPGIGKSVALYFFMCAAAEARIPFVFHRVASADAYVCLDEQAFDIPASIISKLAFTTRALVLIDSCSDVGLSVDVYAVRSAHVVLASPPVPRRYKEFVKYTGARFYTLDLTKFSELRAILHLHTLRIGRIGDMVSVFDSSHVSLVDIEDVDEDNAVHSAEQTNGVCDPLELFELYGPNLRFALSERNSDAGALEDQSALMQIGANAAGALARGEAIDTSDSALTGYHRVFFEQPDPDSPITRFPPHNLTIPTPFLRGILRDAVCMLKREEQLAALNYARRFHAILHGLQPGMLHTTRQNHDGTGEHEGDAERRPCVATYPLGLTHACGPQDGVCHHGEPRGYRAPASKTATNVVQIGPYDFSSHSAETTVQRLIDGLPCARGVVKPRVTMCKNDHFVLCKFPTTPEAAVLVSAWRERSPELKDCGVVYVDLGEPDTHT